jgi:arylsulfatase
MLGTLRACSASGISGEPRADSPRIRDSTVRPYRLDYRPLIDADLTDRAIDFMRRQSAADKPFFVYLPYTATHFPTLPHPDFAGKTGNGPWADLLLQIDTYVGRLVDTIDELGAADDTIIIFTADNGPESLDFNQTQMTVETAVHGSAGPWRGTLFTGFEGGLRVPFAVRWPGRIEPGRVSDEIVHAMDLFPTLAAIAGGRVPDDRPIDGIEMRLGSRWVHRLHGQRRLRREVAELEAPLQGTGRVAHDPAHVHDAARVQPDE